jgi:hypothetical protein
MKASELRIGNLIQWESSGHTQAVMKIDEIGLHTCVNDVKIEDVLPIPITEGFLVKWFGFDKYDNPNGTPSWCYSKAGDVWIYQTWKDKEFFIRSFSVRFQKNITYIHQLQNLYFALTGEELKTN